MSDEYLNIPLREGVHIRRNERGGVNTNVPRLVAHHSPTGFNFGYDGSGPADLALNLVEAALRELGFRGPLTACWKGKCFSAAWYIHQDVKRRFIAPIQGDGAVLDFDEVVSFIKDALSEYGMEL